MKSNQPSFDRILSKTPKISFKPGYCNHVLEEMIKELKNLDVHPLNGDLPHEWESCYRSLIVHRSSTKYSRKGSSDSRNVALNAYIRYEEDVIRPYVRRRPLDNLPKGHGLNKTRHYINSVLSDFNIWDILRNAPLRFSPGKTFLSTVDETSIVAKLGDKRHWTVTSNCLDYAVFLIYHCRGLKMAAKAFIPKVSGTDRKLLFLRFKTGFNVFKYLLIKHVLVVTDGALGATVPKNELTDRFINIESNFNVLVQACIEQYLRKKLKFLGNDLNVKTEKISSTQHLHGLLIKHPELCTVDLKNASDSTILYSVEKLFPRHFCSALFNSRSYVVEIPLDGGVQVFPEKLSSMGNGYTFGLMSFFLHSIGVSNNIPLNVFGDDIILKSTDYPRFKDLIELVGYQINTQKSFVDHPFRESCGYFYHTDFGYFTSFDITRIDTIVDLVTTTNKLFILLQECLTHGFDDLVTIFSRARDELLSKVPALQKGPVPCSRLLQLQNLSLYVYDWDFLKKQKKSKACRDYLSVVTREFSRSGVDLHHDASVVLVPRFRNRKSDFSVGKNVENLLHFQHLFANKKRGKGTFHYEPCEVFLTGSIHRIAHILRCDLDVSLFSFSQKREEETAVKTAFL